MSRYHNGRDDDEYEEEEQEPASSNNINNSRSILISHNQSTGIASATSEATDDSRYLVHGPMIGSTLLGNVQELPPPPEEDEEVEGKEEEILLSPTVAGGRPPLPRPHGNASTTTSPTNTRRVGTTMMTTTTSGTNREMVLFEDQQFLSNRRSSSPVMTSSSSPPPPSSLSNNRQSDIVLQQQNHQQQLQGTIDPIGYSTQNKAPRRHSRGSHATAPSTSSEDEEDDNIGLLEDNTREEEGDEEYGQRRVVHHHHHHHHRAPVLVDSDDFEHTDQERQVVNSLEDDEEEEDDEVGDLVEGYTNEEDLLVDESFSTTLATTNNASNRTNGRRFRSSPSRQYRNYQLGGRNNNSGYRNEQRQRRRREDEGGLEPPPSPTTARRRHGNERSRMRSGGHLAPLSTERSVHHDERNVHHDEIVTGVVPRSTTVAELYENEKYAQEAGIRFSTSRGDFMSRGPEGHMPQNEEDTEFPILSPRHLRHASNDSLFGSRTPSSTATPRNFFPNNLLSRTTSHDEHGNTLPPNATFLRRRCADAINGGTDVQDDDDNNDEELAKLRLLAGQLSADWKGKEFVGPALARRLRDFQFAQEKRRKKYGNERPWGILGLYDHLASVRMDVEWAEDAAWRRANGEPYHSWAEFEASKNSGFNRPFFTYLVLVSCTVALIASIALNGWVVEPLDVNPMIGPSADTLIEMGAKQTRRIVNDDEAWRVVSPMGLHAGVIHYLLNMLALWFIGSAVEQCHGFIPALILFVVPAIGGTILSAIFLPDGISVGASGGIFGLIGACLADIIMNWRLLFSDFVNPEGGRNRHIVVLVFLFLDIVVNCIVGLTPFVDNFTHLGGMLFGFLCGLSTMERVSSDFFGVEQERRCLKIAKGIFIRFLGLIITVVCIVTATILLLQGDGETTPCKACSSLSCVPFPPWSPHDQKWWYCDDCAAVTADATTNQVTGVFEQLNLNCPDGDMVVVVLDDDDRRRDKLWLEKKLPTFCRAYCANLSKT